ncbi:MAG: TlpA family protein disulfide reductase [Myxococcales bacterium]|nr:TlpA family protein disulfide reductase [Myxococcales bacterium]
MTANSRETETSTGRATWAERLRRRFSLGGLLRGVAEGLVIAAVVLLALQWLGGDRIKRGTPAPNLRLRTLAGQTVDLAAFKGQTVIVEFWAPWCKVCRWQVGALNDLFDAKRAVILSVALDYRSHDQVRRFVGEHGVRYPVLLGGRQTSSEFRVDQFPTIYVIDEAGRITHSRSGYTPGWLLRFWL